MKLRPFGGLILIAGMAGLGLLLPGWSRFLLTLALARGLLVLGVVLLMQAGLVSFGQGLFFAAGAYAVGFAVRDLGLRDALVGVALGAGAGLGIAALTGPLLARYRGIFFAMLTLAFSMILYGVLVKAYWITGGTDGLRIPPPTFLGWSPPEEHLGSALYLFTLACTAVMVFLIFRYLQSPLGYTVRAIRDNEVRVEYLGLSVSRALYITVLLVGAMGGLGGALSAMSVGHIDPNLAYWTTSGEFVFVALLGGTGNVFAPLVGSIVFEFLRTYAYKYIPYTWQMGLGLIMLAIVGFAPGGLWSLYELITRRMSGWMWSWKRGA
ncbi:branched-chain amino acid ABC transporter permease [Thermoflexus hugenholtzii]|uniref:Branched-chain amino acid transport system permease protein n=1 Tax=Thermoflexus hugenholtzii JAD2 TaxID=877466 RepID=A0A212RV43_9CHLR|nr:branched-chain amino acid ABC transporter permease [Thermoflexus hugenholtzii]SNB76594.1 branched-chain amino acid transport system permease protein [Thermoflexus hugenholtzii JAD2]